MFPAKIVGFVSSAITSNLIGSFADSIAPRDTLYPTPKRLGAVVAAAIAIEYASVLLIKVLSKRYPKLELKHVI